MGKICYTKEQEKFLLDNCQICHIDELTIIFNDKFKTNKSYDAIKRKVSEIAKGNYKKRRNNLSQEEKLWISENRKNYKKLEDLRIEFNKKFNKNLTYNSIKTFCGRNDIFSKNRKKPRQTTKEELEWLENNYQNYIMDYCLDYDKMISDYYDKFKISLAKHNIYNLLKYKLKLKLPFNQIDSVNARMINDYPIGHEVLTKSGWFVKVSNNPVNKHKNRLSFNYRRKSNIIYEKYYNVKIDDKKEYVMFVDNNFNNFNIENLVLVNWDAQKTYNSRYKCQKREFNNLKIKKIAIMNCELETMIKQSKGKDI